MKKLLLRYLPLLSILFCSLSMSAEEVEVDGIAYTLNSDGTAEVISKSPQYSGDIIIPSGIEYNSKTYLVTSIREYAFNNCIGLTSVEIPNSVSSIKGYAFLDCSGLKDVNIADGDDTLELGSSVFENTPIENLYLGRAFKCTSSKFSELPFLYKKTMTSLTIGNSVTSISSSAFEGCSGLTSLEIGNSVISIGDNAFYGCSGLTSLEIPNSVTSIGESAFYYCSGIKEIKIVDGNTTLEFGSNVFYEVPIETLYLGRNSGCPFKYKTSLKSITIGNSVTSIGWEAFYGCSGLKEVNIVDGDNALEFGYDVFYNAPIETLYLGRTFVCASSALSKRPFYNKTSMKSVALGNSVTSIGEYAFYGCKSLTSIEIPNSVTVIDNEAFFGCSGLTSIEIGNSVTSIGQSAFYGCRSLISLEIPNSVTSIDNEAFCGCESLKTVNIADGETIINFGSKVFVRATYGHDSPIESLYLGRSFKCSSSVAYEQPFQGSPYMKSLTIGNSVSSIPGSAFKDCRSLTSVSIGNSVTSIGESAFSGCYSLKNAEFADVISMCKIEYGNEYSNPLYNAHNLSIHGEEIKKLNIPEGVTSIQKYAFYGCSGLTSVEIPNSVSSIGKDAFYGSNGLKDVKIVDGNTTLELGSNVFYDAPIETLYLGRTFMCSSSYTSDQTFYNKKSIKSLTIGNTVTLIGNNAFSGCSGLTEIEIPNSVISIGSGAFSGCNGLISLVIPNSVMSIGSSAFSGCSGINEINIVNGESIIEFGSGVFADVPVETLYLGRNFTCIASTSTDQPFRDKSSIQTVKIGNFVTSIVSSAFEGCSGLTSIVMPNTITSIHNYAFRGCSGLSSVEIPNSVKLIGELAFGGCRGLTSIEIPNSVTTIQDGVFDGCSNLRKVSISDGEENLEMGCKVFVNVPVEMLYLGRTFTCTSSNSSDIPFRGKSYIKSVTIGNNVASIDDFTFYGCSGLKEVKITDGDELLAFGSNVFYNAPIETLYLGRNFTCNSSNSKEQPFYDKTSIKSLTIGNSVSSISSYAFSGCSGLTSVAVPNSVNTIGSHAFSGCSGLTSVAISNSVTSIGMHAFSGCSGLTSVEIPNTVTSIGDSAFSGCVGLEKLTLGDSLDIISAYAFADSDLVEIISHAKNAPKIYESSFSPQTRLSCKVNVPEGSLSSYNINWSYFRCFAFGHTTNDIITVSSPGNLINQIPIDKVNEITKLKLIGSLNGTDLLTLNRCANIISLDLSEANIVSGGMPYYEKDNKRFGTEDNTLGEMWSYELNSLSWVKLPETLVKIGNEALKDKKYLMAITIPSSVKSVGNSSFSGCSILKEVSIANGETTLELGSNVFAYAPIDTLYLGRAFKCTSSASSDQPFRGVSSLRSLTIGNSVASFNDNTFYECSGLKEVRIADGDNPIVFGGNVFYNSPIKILYLGRTFTCTSSNAYDQPFRGKSSMERLTIGNFVTSISGAAFQGCNRLSSISFGTSITSIGQYAFYGCSQLSSVAIPNSVTSIGQNAFSGCSGLTTVEIGNSVTSIGQNAFSGCIGLTSVEIPNSVISIGEHAFSGCKALNNVKLSISLTKIEDSTFYGCENLKSVNIPDPVQIIETKAFMGCSSLENLILPGSIRAMK
ncbi:MAG: leucine-rich repeat domain-containing protein, partial [Muribaculaceae bacterium]|nr:leucine-rich repeat domain-containing protein [Muribaculaceae bacterium]